MDLLKKPNLKKTSLHDELEDKNDEVERLKINFISQGESSKDQEELEETKRYNVDLKIQLEEAKMMKDVLMNQLNERDKTCERLEMEVVDLRKKNEKSSAYVKLNNNSAILNKILSCQRSPFDKTGLGYNMEIESQEDISKTPKKIEAGPSFSKDESQAAPHIPTKDIIKLGGYQGVSPTPWRNFGKDTS